MNSTVVLDIGSSAIKFTVFQYNSKTCCIETIWTRSRKYELPKTSEDLLLLKNIVFELFEECYSSGAIVAENVEKIVFTSFAMSLTFLKHNENELRPVSKIYMYSDECDKDLSASFDVSALNDLGVPLFGSSFAHNSLLEYSNELGADTICTVGSYLLHSIFGRPIDWLSFSEYSWLGLLSKHTNKLHRCFDNYFENIKTPTVSQKVYNKSYPCLVDGYAVTLAANKLIKNSCCITIGTSSAIRVLVDVDEIKYHYSSGLFMFKVSESKCLFGGALSDGGSLHAWFEKCFLSNVIQDVDQRQRVMENIVEQALVLSTTEIERPLILPFLRGERSLGWNSNRKLSMTGIYEDTTLPLIYLSLFEGLVFQLKKIWDTMKSQLSKEYEFVLTGGAILQSKLLPVLISNIFGREVNLFPKHLGTEATSIGAALYSNDSWTLNASAQTQAPNCYLREFYSKQYQKFANVVEAS